jgi:hypothetical protein
MDGRLGNLVDFIMDDNPWVLRWLLIEPSYLLPGKMVVLDMDAVKSIDCAAMDIWMEACTNEVENKTPTVRPGIGYQKTSEQ